MSLAELVITSVMLEGRSKSEVARDYRISRCWVHELVRRYEAEGEAAFQPRSRRPHGNPLAIGPELEDRVIRLRKSLTGRVWTPARRRSGSICSGTRRWPGFRRSPRSGESWPVAAS